MSLSVIEYCCFILDTLFEVLCLCRIFSMKIWSTNHPLPVILTYMGLSTFFSYIFPDSITTLLLFPMSYLAYIIMYKKGYLETLIGYFLAYVYIIIIQDLFMMVFSRFNIESPKLQAVIGETGSISIGLILLLFVPVHKIYTAIMKSNLYIKCTLIDLALMLLMEILITKFTSIDATVMIPLLISFAIIVFISDYLIIEQQKTITKQQESLESYHTYEPMMDNLIKDIRRRQHDYANELNAIQMIACSYDDYASLSKALNEHIDAAARDFRQTDLIKLNMKVLSGFLYSKLETARKADKDIDFTIKNFDLSSNMPEYELIKVVGILTDNALEAVEPHDCIKIEIDSDNNRIIFTTINNGPKLTPELRANMVKVGYTTKTVTNSMTSKRGTGLANAKQLLDSYNGELYIENPPASGDTLIKFEFIV